KLFFDVEEFTEHPELGKEGKEAVLKKFASRFSKKLFGELIEDKWNKKLIGLSISLPTEKEMLTTFATIKSKIEIVWHKRPYDINILNSRFDRVKVPFERQAAIEHIKYSISEPSANFIIENTLKLGSNLINLSNTGTIDESKDEIIRYLINYIKERIVNINEPHTINWLISYIERVISEVESYFNKFLEYSKNFLSTGEIGDLNELLGKYRNYIIEKGKLENITFEKICNLAINSINRSIVQKKNLRGIELISSIYYFSEIFKSSFQIIRNSLPHYFSRRRLKTLVIEFIKKIKIEFDKEQKPAMILGRRFIEKFNTFLFNQIEINPILLKKDLKFNENNLIIEFKDLINKNNEIFFNNIELNISDLVSFAEVLMEKDPNIIRTHIENFKKFSGELHYLLSYLLRYSTINRYLKEEPDGEISDPVTFANRFHRFLEKRIGGINLIWKSYILGWILDYTKKFFKLKEQNVWNLKEIYDDFISYFEKRESNEQQPEKFLEFLDVYIAQRSDELEKNHLLEFLKQYEFCLHIKKEFPRYLKNKITNEINLLNIQVEELIPVGFFSINKKDTFYNYIKEMELKYFSKLIPRPLSLILKHNLTNEEKELFKADLYHVFNFKYWGKNNVKIDLADNFKEAYREWVKEL
ncbi:MAG: hypothetical protein ACFFAN_16695, partial [Promethearchaeota archaeon]